MKFPNWLPNPEKLNTVGKFLIKPCILKAVEELLVQENQKIIRELSLSNDTVKSSIQKMLNDIEEQIIDKIKGSPHLRYNVTSFHRCFTKLTITCICSIFDFDLIE